MVNPDLWIICLFFFSLLANSVPPPTLPTVSWKPNREAKCNNALTVWPLGELVGKKTNLTFDAISPLAFDIYATIAFQ